MDQNKRSRSRSPARQGSSKRFFDGGDKVEVRLLIKARDAGAVIGKGGENVKKMRTEHSASVTVTDSRTVERLIVMKSSLEGVRGVILDVANFIINNIKNEHDAAKDLVDLRLLIHQSQAGCIIGKGGAKLKELRSEMDVDLKVFTECLPQSTERVISVKGGPEKVTNCLVSIVEMLQTWPPRGYMEEYDAENYDEYMARECGGYFDDDRRGGGGRRSGGGRRNSRSGRDRYDDRHGDRFDGPNMGPLGALSMMLGQSMRQTSQQVSIPAEMAGVIIGKSGTNMRRIKGETGADIEMDDISGGPNDRIITIYGTPDQIQAAQYMMQMSVKQHLMKNK